MAGCFATGVWLGKVEFSKVMQSSGRRNSPVGNVASNRAIEFIFKEIEYSRDRLRNFILEHYNFLCTEENRSKDRKKILVPEGVQGDGFSTAR
jgi:hypothetical protein